MTKLFTKPDCIDCESAICDECDSNNHALGNVIEGAFGRKPKVEDGGEGPYLNASCRCLRCKHQWQGVMPVGTVVLECPACGCFAGCIAGLVEPEGERWVCSCEGQLFFLDRIGPPMCASCGLRAQEWVDTP